MNCTLFAPIISELKVLQKLHVFAFSLHVANITGYNISSSARKWKSKTLPFLYQKYFSTEKSFDPVSHRCAPILQKLHVFAFSLYVANITGYNINSSAPQQKIKIFTFFPLR